MNSVKVIRMISHCPEPVLLSVTQTCIRFFQLAKSISFHRPYTEHFHQLNCNVLYAPTVNQPRKTDTNIRYRLIVGFKDPFKFSSLLNYIK